MGLFGRRNTRDDKSTIAAQNNYESPKPPPPPPTKEDKARDYFLRQGVTCFTPEDMDAYVKMYEALKENNYDTYNDDNLKDALSSLDANVYHLCQAIMYQNFMLLRRIDRLEWQIKDLERKIDD